MTDLVEWLRSALDEHEAWARAASRAYKYADVSDARPPTVETWQSGNHDMPHTYMDQVQEMDPAAAGHIIRNDPAHVLRTVQAHREILDWVQDRQQPGSTVGDDYWFPLVAIARIYREHPGFDPSWLGDS